GALMQRKIADQPASAPEAHPSGETDERCDHARVVVSDQTDAEVARWRTDRAGSAAWIANEVAEIVAVAAFDDVYPAVLHFGFRRSGVGCVADVAACGPFPDVAGDIEQPVPVRAEAAERMGGRVGVAPGGRFALVGGEPAFRGIASVAIGGDGIVVETLPGGVGPFCVGGEPVAMSRR